MSSKHCSNQAYAIGKHIALQCHVEMTEAMIMEWCKVGATEVAENLHGAGVQSTIAMQNLMPQYLPKLNELATRMYTQWIRGLNK